MFNPDETYVKIERNFTNMLRSTGQVENSFWQHVGKIYNRDIGTPVMFDQMLASAERMMTGQKKHGFEQNKKSDFERLKEKGLEEDE